MALLNDTSPVAEVEDQSTQPAQNGDVEAHVEPTVEAVKPKKPQKKKNKWFSFCG